MAHRRPWIPLQAHSDYALVKGIIKPQALVERACQLQLPALALTDTVSCAGWPRFSKAAYAAGIKPILGVSLRLQWAGFFEGKATLLAKDAQGHKQLMVWISELWQQAPVGANAESLLLPWEDCRQGLAHVLVLLHGGEEGAGKSLIELERCPFDLRQEPLLTRNLYLTVERWSSEGFPWEKSLLQRAAMWGLPVVATQPILFLEPAHEESHRIRVAIQRGLWSRDSTLQTPELTSAYFPSSEAMESRYADLPEALQASWSIAQRCNLHPEPFAFRLPRFESSEGFSETANLQAAARRGLKERFERGFCSAEAPSVYQLRLEQELKLIDEMGFSGYFLVVFEFIQWAKAAKIPVGPGRGSGVGSLVAYALAITDLDPLKYQLLFERFLNPARLSMPDFDIDFCPEMRDRVVDHVVERYGSDRVAQIAAFGSLRARASVRDVGRALGYPYGLIDKWARTIPAEPTITLKEALESSPMLRQGYQEDEEVRNLLDHALVLEGVQRHMGKHAGGVVIAPEPLAHFTPLVPDAEGHRWMTQLDKGDIEGLGLVKFDFLGLTTLTILNETLKALHAHQATLGQPPLELLEIPLDDAKSFDLLQSGKTEAIFQLDTRGAKALAIKLQPDKFEEIIALVALNRPGPLQSGMVENFIHRKKGVEPLAYPDPQYQHPKLQPILEETYGVILYQEQVIQIAQALAGYSLLEADLFRRAIGKKDEEVMTAQRKRFVDGAVAQAVSSELALKIFELVDKFAGYGFNKSHSAAYALVSYQTLYLKAHFPDFFMAAVLSSECGNFEKLPPLLEATRLLGVQIEAPDINRGQGPFVVLERGSIAYGLEAIRGIGRKVVEHIVAVRKEGGPFQSLEDFCERVSSTLVPKGMVEKLIMVGAFDGFNLSRAEAWEALPHFWRAVEHRQLAQASGQQSLFGPSQLMETQAPSWKGQGVFWNDVDQAFKAYRLLGHFSDPHPLWGLAAELSLLGIRLEEKGPWGQGSPTRSSLQMAPPVAAVLERIRVMRNKMGESFCLLVLSGVHGAFEAFWPGQLSREAREELEAGEVVVGRGSWRSRTADELPRLNLKQLTTLRALRRQQAHSVHLVFEGQALEGGEPQRLQAIWSWLKRLKNAQAGLVFFGEVEGLTPGMGRPVWALHPAEGADRGCFDLSAFPLLEASALAPSLKALRIQYPRGEVVYENRPASAFTPKGMPNELGF